MPKTSRTSRLPAWGAHALWPILALGFLVRLVAMLRQEIVSVDGTTYIRLARSLMGTGPRFDTVQPPGYPLLIGLASALHPADDVRAAQIVALVTGTLLLWPFHALARRFLAPREALLATVFMALTPVAIRMSATTMSESPYILALLVCLLLLVRQRPFQAGLAGGVALFIRPEALVIVPGFALVQAVCGIPRRSAGNGTARDIEPPAARRRAALLLLAGFVIGGIIPALLYSRVQYGTWSLTGKGGLNVTSPNFWQRELTVDQLAAGPDALGMLKRLERHAQEVIAHYPRMALAHSRQIALALGPPAVAAALIGVAAAPILAVPLLMLVLLPLFPALSDHPRFTLPIVPFLWILAFLGLERLATTRVRRVALALVTVGWVVVSIVEFRRLPRNEDGYFPELRAAGLVLRDVAPADAIVFDRKPYTSFYARRTGHTIPLGSYDATIDAMNRYGGTYLIVCDSVTPLFRPELAPLLNDSVTMLHDPRLALVYFDERDPLRRVAIYQFVRPELPPISEGQRRRAAELVRNIPHDPKRHGPHADLLRRGEDYEGMCRECELLLAVEPDNWRARLNLALGLTLLERDRPRALELLRQAEALKPGQPEIEQALLSLGATEP